MSEAEKKKKRIYMRYDEAKEYYGVSRNTLMKWVRDSGAQRKVGNVCLINIEVVDRYIESFSSSFE